MENTGNWEQKPLINELIQGRELAKQLRIHLNQSSPMGESLIENILSSFDNALLMINNKNGPDGSPKPIATTTIAAFESPYSSPQSDDTDRCDSSKKRKMLPQWTEQVQGCPGSGLEGPLDDGFSWRKYGQKDILGAKYPRGYYRCTYRNGQGCLATKQVQRSEDNPMIFDVTYRGSHTCIQMSQLTRATQTPEKEDRKQNQEQQKQKQPQEVLLNFKTGLEVKTENLDIPGLTTSFSFPSTSIECIRTDNHIFSSSSMLDNNFMGSFSPPFISPTTSASNSPIVDLDFSLDSLEFDPNFPFNNQGFFN